MTGTRLAHYEITHHLGSGGMGDVYQAMDSKLGRHVAIKILPAAFASDAVRLSRFRREAQVLASLNHPHVAQVYGIEETGETRYIVMELVEGETLQARLHGGPVPLDESLAIARQIADALEAAHEKNVIHRDLKPGNVMLTREDSVKVLDFGLAKANDTSLSNSNLSDSPTIAAMAATSAGVILGTAAYMSPEQARGRPVDKRTDVWAFGCVLYELLAGKPAFPGEDAGDILAAIVKSEPDWTALPPGSPVRLLKWCLEKDPRRRLRDIGDASLEPERPEADRAGVVPVRRTLLKEPLVWALAGVAAAALVFAGLSAPASEVETPVRLSIALPSGQELTSYPAISRDGRTAAYVTQHGNDDSQLYLRDLNSFEARVVTGSNGARQPFFSPDGKWVAFFAQGQLQKAEVSGGAPIRLAEAPISFGGTWFEDNTIVYTGSLASGLSRIPAAGGTPESLTKPDGAASGYAHVYPSALPGGRRVFFTIWGRTQGGAVLSLDSAKWEIVLPQKTFAAGIFDAPGGSGSRLLLVDQAGGVRAAAFDPERPARTTAETLVLSGVNYDPETEPQSWLAISDTRTAVYAPGNPARTSLVWVDREGNAESPGTEQDVYREAIVSPDGARAVVRHGLDLWIHDLQRGSRSRLTSETSNLRPIWSLDGTRVIFGSNRGGEWDIYSQPADASRPAEVFLKKAHDQFPLSILADGTLLYLEVQPTTGRDLMMLSPDGKTSTVRATAANENAGVLSPGPAGQPRWVAYSSDESGRNEIYVQSFPSGANRVAVSTDGGILPRWSRDGKELFYVGGDSVMTVPVQRDGSFGAPRRLFDRSDYFFKYIFDVSPDGKRFLMIRRDRDAVPRQLNVILNWPD